MEVHLSKWQTEVWDDTHRFKVICAGRRSGKSVLSQLIVINWAQSQTGNYYIVSPTYRQAKSIHWNEIRKLIPKGIIEKTNETELSITLKNGSVIELKGAENPDALRGIKLKGLVIDEIASIRNWDWLWSEVLRPTLTDYTAPAIFISTPKGYNHFWDLYNSGQESGGDYKSWRFTSYDNPYIPKEEIDNAKKELTEDTFEQEYMADFRKHTGLAHKDWNRDIHFIEPFDIPRDWYRERGWDFGQVDFTASTRGVFNHDEVMFIDSCYLNNTSNVKDHAEAILTEDYNLGHIQHFGDPSGKQWIAEFSMHGINIQPADKEVGQGFKGWVEYCIDKVNSMLKPVVGHTVTLPDGRVIKDAPHLFVLKNGKTDKLVSQIEMLSWKETATGDIVAVLEDGGDPTGGHYDLMAALRYLVVSHRKNRPKGAIIDESIPLTRSVSDNPSIGSDIVITPNPPSFVKIFFLKLVKRIKETWSFISTLTLVVYSHWYCK